MLLLTKNLSKKWIFLTQNFWINKSLKLLGTETGELLEFVQEQLETHAIG